jgi:hypothetical protein
MIPIMVSAQGRFRQVRPPLLTAWPVITESMYLVAFSRRAQDGLLEMIQRGAVAIAPLTGQDVPRLRALMEEYRIPQWTLPTRHWFESPSEKR